MSRLSEAFARARAENRAAFVAYLCAGDPDFEGSLAACRAVLAGGVDVLELGVPFSDPLADGLTNQLAAQRALESGYVIGHGGQWNRRSNHPKTLAPQRQDHLVPTRAIGPRSMDQYDSRVLKSFIVARTSARQRADRRLISVRSVPLAFRPIWWCADGGMRLGGVSLGSVSPGKSRQISHGKTARTPGSPSKAGILSI